MEELLNIMQVQRETAYKLYREEELTGTEKSLAYIDGVLDGIDSMIALVKAYIAEQ